MLERQLRALGKRSGRVEDEAVECPTEVDKDREKASMKSAQGAFHTSLSGFTGWATLQPRQSWVECWKAKADDDDCNGAGIKSAQGAFYTSQLDSETTRHDSRSTTKHDVRLKLCLAPDAKRIRRQLLYCNINIYPFPLILTLYLGINARRFARPHCHRIATVASAVASAVTSAVASADPPLALRHRPLGAYFLFLVVNDGTAEDEG
jgi:hypothetical protein